MNKLENRMLQVLRAHRKKLLSQSELAKKCRVTKKDKPQFLEILNGMREQNRVIEKNGRLLLCENVGLTAGRIIKVTGTFGFARPADAEKDVFIPGKHLSGALPGDGVLLRITRGSGELPEGEVFKITEEVQQKFAGVLELDEHGAAFVKPDRYLKFPVRIESGRQLGAGPGDKVLCTISRRGGRHTDLRARVLEVFGGADSAAACCRAVLAANDIHADFPPEALEQAQAIAAGDGIHPKELASRLDLRDEILFTIDGADSKDLDDAISLRRRDDGWDLGVHIADVSYYVTHGTPLDREALLRGTSVYYADSVIPMLPPELSNGICSLNPHEDRLAFSALMRLDETGTLREYNFSKTVIRSRVKGVYSEVNTILAGTADSALLKKYAGLTETLMEMRALAAVLTQNRLGRGGLNLESTESKLVLDEAGRAVDVVARTRGESEMMIEEFMLTANEAAASFALRHKLPFVYRVHESPSPDRITQLYDVLDQLGVSARRPQDGVTSAQLASVVTGVKNTPVERVVGTMVLRSMAKAKYSDSNTGHFGLAMQNYTHFTSPIRRYPDLTIHRILSGYVTGMKQENLHKRFGRFVGEAAEQSSQREIAAMTAERDCEDCYKAEFMRAHLGQEFRGVISSVVPFGIYVQLENTVEGLVHISTLPDGQWQADGSLSLVELHTGHRLRLGQIVHIQVAGADVSAGTINFVLNKSQQSADIV